MYEMLRGAHDTGRQPWAAMYADGHGEHWLGTTRFIARHRREWQQAITSTSTR